MQSTFNDLKSTLNNNDTMYFIVQQIMASLNNNPQIEPQFRNKFSQYWTKFSGDYAGNTGAKYSLSMNNDIKPLDLKEVRNSSSQNIAILAVAYYLSNLNKYDFHLINYCMRVGMDTQDIIMLLLLNDIYSIDVFCKKKSIHSQSYYVILTLKRLSALHKVETSFN